MSNTVAPLPESIAVALALYTPNRPYLREQLQSLAEQTVQGFWLYVRDDSPPGHALSVSQTEFESLCSQAGLVKARVQWVDAQERVGAPLSFAKIFQAILHDEYRGTEVQFVLPCDQDDIWEPGKIETLWRAVSVESDIMAAHCDLSMIDAAGRLSALSVWQIERRDPHVNSPEALIHRNSVTGCAMIVRTEVLRRAQPFPEVGTQHPPQFYHDVWLALCARSLGRVIAWPEALVRYRQHGGNAVGAEAPTGRTLGGLLRRLPEKALAALRSRQVLEDAWIERQGVDDLKRLATADVDFGLGYVLQTARLSLRLSRGYLRIGLLLALGKMIYDFKVLSRRSS